MSILPVYKKGENHVALLKVATGLVGSNESARAGRGGWLRRIIPIEIGP
jgi:hypothetical protein